MESKESTKLQSYKKAKSSTVRDLVIEVLKSEGALSRFDISTKIDRRLSSVCGRVNELIADGLVEVVGRKVDPETDMQVELIATTYR